jgi:type IV secretory pathway VirJ component
VILDAGEEAQPEDERTTTVATASPSGVIKEEIGEGVEVEHSTTHGVVTEEHIEEESQQGDEHHSSRSQSVDSRSNESPSSHRSSSSVSRSTSVDASHRSSAVASRHASPAASRRSSSTSVSQKQGDAESDNHPRDEEEAEYGDEDFEEEEL